MTFFQFNASVPDMPSKKTLQRKRAKARKKAHNQPVQGWENVPKIPTALCKIIRDYVSEFQVFPTRLNDTCEKWFNLHVRYKTVIPFLNLVPLPDPFEHPILRAQCDQVNYAVSENTKTAKAILETIMKSQCIDKYEATLRTQSETALENVLLKLDPISPVFRERTTQAGVRCSFSQLIELAVEGKTNWPE